MSGYAVAQIDEIDEIDDGRVLSRPVRFHFGITSFGVNAFTAHQVGYRLINEHDESQAHDLQEELYLVQRGRATFELDGDGWTHPRAHSSSRAPRSSGQRSLRSRGRRSLCSRNSGEGVRGRRAARSGCRSTISTSQASTPRPPIRDASRSKLTPSTPGRSTTSRAARASPVGQTTRSGISGSRSTARNRSVRLLPGTATSTRSATRPLSGSWFRATHPSQLLADRIAPFASGDIREHGRRRPSRCLDGRRWLQELAS